MKNKPTLHSHTITHVLFIFEGVRECFAFAKSHQPTRKPKLGKECVCPTAQPTDIPGCVGYTNVIWQLRNG